MRRLLTSHLRRGEKGELFLDSSALEIPRHAEALQREGLSITEGMATIRDEMSGNVGGEQERSTGNEELVEALKCENEHLRSEVTWLREQVDALRPLALPRPRRWFAWLQGRSHSTGASRIRPLTAFWDDSLAQIGFSEFVFSDLAIRYGGSGCSPPSLALPQS